jgi:C_GCAxxG_C_C family probable redox protein
MTAVSTMEYTKEELLDLVTKDAEQLFRSGTYFCSEAVVQTINELLGMPYEADVVRLASGFPIGMGKAGCLCGAVSGGQMALGMAFGRVEGEAMPPKMFEVAKKLHDYIMDNINQTVAELLQENGRVIILQVLKERLTVLQLQERLPDGLLMN